MMTRVVETTRSRPAMREAASRKSHPLKTKRQPAWMKARRRRQEQKRQPGKKRPPKWELQKKTQQPSQTEQLKTWRAPTNLQAGSKAQQKRQ